MTPTDRREFLKKLAKGAVYAGPVIVSMAAPTDVTGQGKSSQHHTHPDLAPGAAPPTRSPFPPPPGSKTPPGTEGPPQG
jgi:hypothetical protein